MASDTYKIKVKIEIAFFDKGSRSTSCIENHATCFYHVYPTVKGGIHAGKFEIFSQLLHSRTVFACSTTYQNRSIKPFADINFRSLTKLSSRSRVSPSPTSQASLTMPFSAVMPLPRVVWKRPRRRPSPVATSFSLTDSPKPASTRRASLSTSRNS